MKERGCKCEENKPRKWAESKTGWINVKCKLSGGEGRAKINYGRWELPEQREERLETNKLKSDEEAKWNNRARWKKLTFFKSFFFFKKKKKQNLAESWEKRRQGLDIRQEDAHGVIMKTKCVFCLVWLLCESGTVLTCGNIHSDVLKVYWLW